MVRVREFAIPALMVGTISFGVAYWLNYEQWVRIPEAEHIMAAQLRDPDSAQFRNGRIVSSGWLCGEVNSKNGNGGYAGFTRFISGGKNGTFRLEGEGLLGEQPTQEFIDVLGHQNEILGALVKLREQNPDIRIPSESSLREQAVSNLFEERWKEICA